jgi:hypothetical protein
VPTTTPLAAALQERATSETTTRVAVLVFSNITGGGRRTTGWGWALLKPWLPAWTASVGCVSARLWDSAPESEWVADAMQRDSMQLINNERFSAAFDTFYDRRNAMVCMVSPIGGFRDEEITAIGSRRGRIEWEDQPGSELCVVYNDVRDTELRGSPMLEHRAFVVKFTRLFRF